MWEDPGHRYYEELQYTLDTIAMLAPTVVLNEDSVQAAREYRYVPWAIGGGPGN
jgi:uncharacterized membrane protein YwaF